MENPDANPVQPTALDRRGGSALRLSDDKLSECIQLATSIRDLLKQSRRSQIPSTEYGCVHRRLTILAHEVPL